MFWENYVFIMKKICTLRYANYMQLWNTKVDNLINVLKTRNYMGGKIIEVLEVLSQVKFLLFLWWRQCNFHKELHFKRIRETRLLDNCLIQILLQTFLQQALGHHWQDIHIKNFQIKSISQLDLHIANLHSK